MRIGIYYLSLFALISLVSCGDNTPKNTGPSYNNACCCNSLISVGSTKVFVPNIFTPNADFVNDQFQILGSTGIDYITQVRIYGIDSTPLHLIDTTFGISNNRTWDGMVNNAPYDGDFLISALVTPSTGSPILIKAKSCVFRCNALNNSLFSKAGCRPPDVYDLATAQDTFKTNDDCLK